MHTRLKNACHFNMLVNFAIKLVLFPGHFRITNVYFCSHLEMLWKNNEPLAEMIASWAANHTIKEILSVLESNGVPAAPIYDLEQIVGDPHIASAREMVQQILHPALGLINLIGNPIKMSLTNPKIRTSSPLLGEHTDQVLAEYDREG